MLGTAQRHYPQKPKPVPEPNKAASSHSVSADSLSSVQCRGEVHAGRALKAKMLLNCGCQQKPGEKGTSRTLQRESQERLRRHKGQRGGGHGAAACEGLGQRAPIQSAPCSKAAGLKRHVRQRGAVLVECRAAVPRDSGKATYPAQCRAMPRHHVTRRASVAAACHLLAQHSGGMLAASPKSPESPQAKHHAPSPVRQCSAEEKCSTRQTCSVATESQVWAPGHGAV